LDKLLGFGGPGDNAAEIGRGAIVLLRGGPGSGKTTLGLQWINQHLKNPGNSALLVSLEEDPEQLIKSVRMKFGFELPEPKPGSRFRIGGFDIYQALFGNEVDAADLPTQAAVAPRLREFLKPSTLVFIDSLDALAPTRLAAIAKKKKALVDIRLLLRELIDDVKKCFKNSVLLLSSEHHIETNRPEGMSAVSFACDVEILLCREPILGESGHSHNLARGAGYNVERRLGDNPEQAQAVESRSFCRVLKNRYGPSQSRRCTYDIVPHKGIVFYEKYLGDGELLLFYENSPVSGRA
jgi:hypothetical protein